MREAYDSVDLSSLRPDPLLQRQLAALAADGGVQWWLATNSPRSFVGRVLRALRVHKELTRIHCPSQANDWASKPQAKFFEGLPRGAPLFDDAAGNCAGSEATGRPGVHVDGSAEVMCLVADRLGVCPAAWRLAKDAYLRKKEGADLRSLNREVLGELGRRLAAAPARPLRCLDLGSGLLSMLPVVARALDARTPPLQLQYVAVDHDSDLCAAAADRLQSEMGARAVPEGLQAGAGPAAIAGASFPRRWALEVAGCSVEVELRDRDVLQALEEEPAAPYDLILGCSILDLVDARRLATALEQRHPGALLYFPIHYAGSTVFQAPAGLAEVLRPLTACYDESLRDRGQSPAVGNATLELLGETLALGPSPWELEASGADLPLLRQLASFMATNALGYQPRAAVAAAVSALRDLPAAAGPTPAIPRLHVANRDFLGQVRARPVESAPAPRRRTFVEFTGPGVVRVAEEELPARRPGEATVLATLSAVSAGTEQRVLEGCLTAAAEPVDVSIGALGAEEPGWPLRYGYALVGRVAEPGSTSLGRGQRVFCFHPHASAANVPESDMHGVPECLSDVDAALFPVMETALSLAQDAAPVPGDRVAVFGAGTVGALTAAVLSHHRFDVTVFEPDAARAEVVARCCPNVTLNTGTGFDVLVEASGSAQGLQQAVDLAGRGARLVVGSWYGEAGVQLPLGLRFHRSELALVASQVSRVSAPLSARWTKGRRWALTWALLQELRPASWLPLQQVPVEEAPAAYAAPKGGPQLFFAYGGDTVS